MTEEQFTAWAAGIYEGEGTAHYSLSAGYRVGITSSDEDVVQRFHEVVGFGTIYGPYRHGNRSNKPLWLWGATNRQGVRNLLELFRPFLLTRRVEQLERVLRGKDAQ